MYSKTGVVKTVALAGCLILSCLAAWAGEGAAAKPHMMYFYNPSCRLCTKTNEVVATAEEKYKDVMSHQRLNIADPESGTDNVLYMFELMDEMGVPEETNVTLIVFLGLLDEEGGEIFFSPKHVLVEGDAIIEKLDATITGFLAEQGKGEKLGMTVRPAGLFLAHRLCLASGS